jgi:hypothetical protein
MKRVLQGLAVASLVYCGVVAVQRFLGDVPDEVYKSRFLWASVGWFVFQSVAFLIGRSDAPQH